MPHRTVSAGLARVGYDDVSERQLYLLDVAAAAEVPAAIPIDTRHFVALIAWDACREADNTVAGVARRLLDAGCVYFCCWGPGCERVHDAVDDECIRDENSVEGDDSTVMTTWHNDESIEEAAWFTLNCATPNGRFADDCASVIAVSIGNAEWGSMLRLAFQDPRALESKVVD